METSQTPQRLRLLEKGWRERRRVALVQGLGVEPLGNGAQDDFEPLRPSRGINGVDSGQHRFVASGAATKSPKVMMTPGAIYDPGSFPHRPKRIASVSFAVPDATKRNGGARIGSIGDGRDRTAVKGTSTNGREGQAGGPAALPTPPPSPTASPQPDSEAPQGVTSTLKTNDRPSPIPKVSSARGSIKPVKTPPDTRRSAQVSETEGSTKQSDCPAHLCHPRSAIPPSTNTPRAIVSHPLPPSRPIAITSTSSTTIQIPTSPHFEMVLRTDDQMIRIRRGGSQVDISPRTGRVKDDGEDGRGDERKGQRGKGGTCTLRLSEARKWSAQDRQRWISLYDLVEGYKRVVPRVKLWHRLGRLTITCSTPPDIILAYTDTAQDIEKTSSTSQMDSSAISRASSTGTVRIAYSRCRAILQIDLSTRLPAVSKSPSETFRSKRVIAIRTADTSSRHAATGPPTDRERKATQYDTSEKEAGRVLGVQTSTWSSAEREALRRLWCLRHEWERYTEGETRG